jgi:hypothetical protein
MTPDETLMHEIKEHWGTLISHCCSTSSVPPAFIAALIANESGGQPEVTRYEPAVFTRLAQKHLDWTHDRLTANATSWGLTQIMGINYPGAPSELADPETNLTFALKMLAQFAERFQLDVRSEFSDLFHCWNGGHPTAPTFDPAYSQNGLTLMAEYQNV